MHGREGFPGKQSSDYLEIGINLTSGDLAVVKREVIPSKLQSLMVRSYKRAGLSQ